MARRVIVVVNRAAGPRTAARRERILAALDGADRVEILEGRGSALRASLRRAMENAPELVLAAGGDGTVSSCAAAVRGTRSVLGIVPSGTSNSIARSLGIPTEIEAACASIARGVVREIDTAEVLATRRRPRAMMFITSLGFHAETIASTSRDAKRRFGALAYVASAAQRLAEIEPFEVELVTESERRVKRVTAVTVANLAPPRTVWAHGPAELLDDDGLLDVTYVSAETPADVISAGAHLLRTAAEGVPATRDDVGFFRCASVRIAADPPQRVLVDGDRAGVSPVEIRCLPRSVRVIVPPP